MTQDEIRKLLGGYATNALSADERRILYEAALEDQELFNALENEDALKQLLDDPVARDQVRRALQTRRPEFWSRRWVLGVAAPAAVAAIVIAVVYRPSVPQRSPTPPPAASPQIVARAVAPKDLAPKLEAAPPPIEAKKQQALAPRQLDLKTPPIATTPLAAAVTAAPPPSTAAEARLARPAFAAPTMATLRAPAPPAVPDIVREQFAAGFSANAPRYQGPLIRYSLVRGGPNGNAVQVEVTTGLAGFLALYEVDASETKRVYPTGDVATPVMPNVAMQIPANPIEIAGGAHLRLVLVPAPLLAVNGVVSGSLGGVSNGFVNRAALPLQSPAVPPPTPLVVDIPLAPN